MAEILNFTHSGYPAPHTGQQVDVDFAGIFDKLAHADNLANSMAMAKVLANALYARNQITAPEWRGIIAIFEPRTDERMLP